MVVLVLNTIFFMGMFAGYWGMVILLNPGLITSVVRRLFWSHLRISFLAMVCQFFPHWLIFSLWITGVCRSLGLPCFLFSPLGCMRYLVRTWSNQMLWFGLILLRVCLVSRLILLKPLFLVCVSGLKTFGIPTFLLPNLFSLGSLFCGEFRQMIFFASWGFLGLYVFPF